MGAPIAISVFTSLNGPFPGKAALVIERYAQRRLSSAATALGTPRPWRKRARRYHAKAPYAYVAANEPGGDNTFKMTLIVASVFTDGWHSADVTHVTSGI
eukprot:COSAG02_NODE_32113_length_522_cov_0.735225_1_plen_99_part_10